MFKVVILDDEPTVLELLRIYLGRLKEVTITAEFGDPIEFLKAEPQLEFNLLISDVDMPGINGLELIKLVNRPILFVSGKANTYGNELLEASMTGGNVIGAIPKPINFGLLEKLIQKALPENKSRAHPEFFNFRTRSGIAPIRLEKIQCIATSDFTRSLGDSQRKAAKGNKWLYRLEGAPIEILDYTIVKLMKELPSSQFCQISDSEIINKLFVLVYTKHEVKIRIQIPGPDGQKYGQEEELGIGDSFKARFRDFMNS